MANTIVVGDDGKFPITIVYKNEGSGEVFARPWTGHTPTYPFEGFSDSFKKVSR